MSVLEIITLFNSVYIGLYVYVGYISSYDIIIAVYFGILFDCKLNHKLLCIFSQELELLDNYRSLLAKYKM